MNKLVLISIAAISLISISTPPDISARQLRIALVPFENQTGYTRLDYLSDLSFNLIVSLLLEYDGINLFERARADLIVKERRLSSGGEGGVRSFAPVDLIISGAFRMAEERGKKIQLQVKWLERPDDGKVIYERDLPSFANKALRSSLEDILQAGIVGPNELKKRNGGYGKKEISGTTVAVIGFNNYSSRKEYDPLQKGIIYLMEERLSREPDLKVLERDQLKKVLSEHALAVLSGDDGIAFNFIPADFLVAGCFTFSDRTFRIDSRIINVHTTEIESAFHYEAGRDNVLNTSIKMIEDIALGLSQSKKKGATAENLYPHSKEALFYYARGVDLYDRGEYLLAIDNINRALIVDPEYTFGQWEIGRIYEEYLGRYDKALEAYKKVLEQPCGKTIKEKTLLRLAMINYHYINNYRKAIEFLSQFLAEFPDSTYNDIIFYSLGHSYQQMEKYTQALEFYNQGLEDNAYSPLRGSFLVRAGQCYYFSGDHINARKYLEKALNCYSTAIFKAEKGKKITTVKEAVAQYICRLK